MGERRQRYTSVNAAWPDVTPPLTAQEAVSAAKRLYRKALGRPWRGKVRVTSGNRYSWVRGRTMVVNPEAGWHSLVHLLSHYLHRQKHFGARPHDYRHELLERELTEYVVRQGWLEGKLKRVVKPKAPVDRQQERYRRVCERLDRWETKRRRAERAIKKLRASRARYEKLFAQKTAA